MFKKNEIAKVRRGLHNRPCRVRIVDVVGDDAMVVQNDGTVRIVDVKELKPILEGCVSKAQERRIKAQLKLTEKSKSDAASIMPIDWLQDLLTICKNIFELVSR